MHQVIETSEGPLRFAQAGRGDDVVLIHGAMTCLEDMLLGPFDALARRYRVTAVERPGHGATPRRRMNGAPSRQAEHVLAGLSKLGVERFVAVGQSFGGAIAMELAIGAPDRLQGVVAISPIVYPEIRLEHVLYGPRAFPGIGEWIGYGPGRMMDSLLLPSLWHAIFAPQPMPPRFAQHFPFSLASGPQQMIALGEEGVLSFPDLSALASRYHACKVAVMVIAGAADWLAPPWTHAARLSGAVPGAQLRLLAGMGHMLHHFADGEIALAIRRVSAANKTSPRTAA